MATKFLTYPYGSDGMNYSTNVSTFEGMMPNNSRIIRTDHYTTSGDLTLDGKVFKSNGTSGNGQLLNDGNIFKRDTTNSNRLSFEVNTNNNNSNWYRTFFVGVPDTQRNDSGAYGSQARNVTSIWGVVDGNGNDGGNTRVPWGALDGVALLYRTTGGNWVTYNASVQVGEYALGTKLGPYHGYNRRMVFGYKVPSSKRDIVLSNGYYFMGCYLALHVMRQNTGTTTDKCKINVASLTPGFGNGTAWYTKDAKHFIPRRNNTSWSSRNGVYFVQTV